MGNIDKYETRKKMVYDFMCDDMYVPMKIQGTLHSTSE